MRMTSRHKEHNASLCPQHRLPSLGAALKTAMVGMLLAKKPSVFNSGVSVPAGKCLFRCFVQKTVVLHCLA